MLRVVVLTTGQPNQAALCQKLAAHCDIVAIVLSDNRPRAAAARRWRQFRQGLASRLVGRPFRQAWQQLQQRYQASAPRFPEAPCARVSQINDPQTLETLTRHRPDRVIVSGTNLVGRGIIDWASQRGGMINLHTGLSPYMRGGPNCTNWCLAEGALHLIGNTVHWLDAGIDAGPIVATEQTPLTGHETLTDLHWKNMEHAHALCVRAVQRVAAGQPVPRVPQREIAEGRLFANRQWNGRAMRAAWANFTRSYTPHYFAGEDYRRQSSQLRLVSLDSSEAACMS